MSDHGPRFTSIRSTLQGKYEERLPYFGIRVPAWFKKKYPNKYENLVNNSHKLTTPYDVHETLKDIAGLKSENLGKKSRGFSLFKNIPVKRTCDDAHIQPHWCACLHWQSLRVSDNRVKAVSQEVVRTINAITQAHLEDCVHLSLKRILSGGIYKPNDEVMHFKGSSDLDGRNPVFDESPPNVGELLYQVTIETDPGGAHFEATVKYLVKKNKLISNQPRNKSDK